MVRSVEEKSRSALRKWSRTRARLSFLSSTAPAVDCAVCRVAAEVACDLAAAGSRMRDVGGEGGWLGAVLLAGNWEVMMAMFTRRDVRGKCQAGVAGTRSAPAPS